MAQIELIANYNEEYKVWRTSCHCTSPEHSLTFGVETDADHPSQMVLDINVEVSTPYVNTHSEPAIFRPIFSFGRRIKAALKILFTGHSTHTAEFFFRGEEQIDEFIDTIQTHRKFLGENKNGRSEENE